MSETPFIHLHNHTEFSLLDGASRVKDLVNRAKELKMPAIAITDHGAMYGAIDFYQAAKSAGIKPIIGCEVYVAQRTRFDKEPRKDDSSYHLVLLAENLTGYGNLMKIVTGAFIEGFYYKPRVDKDLLRRHSSGLIAMSACLQGEVPRMILAKDFDGARRIALEYQEIFGQENFFFEIQNHGLREQAEVNDRLGALSEELAIPIVATNDCHYTARKDSEAHEVLLCIQTGSTLAEENRLQFDTDQFYIKSESEMLKAAKGFEAGLKTSAAIADRCQVKLELDQAYLPHYEVPGEQTLESYLRSLCLEGLHKRYQSVTPEISERLEHELKVITDMGFPGYFLVVWDFVKAAKELGIRVGPGRGSAAGSIVAYSLGITNIDPLRFDLLFERFLNPERRSLPDIDIDFDDQRREEVIAYVTQKYGEDHVAQLITFGTMQARAAVRDAGRVLGFPYGQVDRIAKMMAEAPLGSSIDDTINMVAVLQEAYKTEEDTKKIIDNARTLEGLARQDSIHAAGVVISRDPLTNYTPLQRKGEGEIVTQYHMSAVQKIGLLKMDFLGLRNLTVIENALKIIKRIHGLEIDIDKVQMEDVKTFDMLQRGDSLGVFQLESSGMRSLLRDMRPSTIDDIIALIALYRPGPLGSGMVKDYVARKHGEQEIAYPHPALEPILGDTYGIIVYQEQVMRIANVMAGYSMAEADILRQAMAKKKPEVLAEQREKFIGGAVTNGFDEDNAGVVFDLVVHFAGYGFNKSHSAAYAMISYQTAYLKANYPIEYMAALLTSVISDKDKVALYINECRRLGIEVLPPDVNESFAGFTAVEDKIRFGLSAIRNVGEGTIAAIIEARKQEPFTTVYGFCRRVDSSSINKRAIESLIKSGAMDSLGATRKCLLEIFEEAVELGIKQQKDAKAGQFTIFDQTEVGSEWLEPDLPENQDEFDKSKLMAFEKEMLGLYVSDHPLLGLEGALRAQTDASTAMLKERSDSEWLWIGGIISGISRVTTKKGEIMAFVSLEDLTGSVEIVVFPKILEKFRELIVEDCIVKVRGRLDRKEDEVKVIAQEFEALDVNKGGVRPIQVTLKSNANRETFEELKRIFSSHPGPAPVFLKIVVADKTTTMSLSEKYCVTNSNGLFAEVKTLLGEDSIALN